MGSSDWALNVLKSGFRLMWDSERAPLTRTPPPVMVDLSMAQEQALDQEVQELLRKQAVELVFDKRSLGFYGRLFTVKKSSGGLRLVLDLSPLNKFFKVD